MGETMPSSERMNELAEELKRAVRANDLDALRRMAESGLVPHARHSGPDHTALDFALHNKDEEAALILIDAGAAVSSSQLIPPLLRAVWSDRVTLRMIDAGHDVREVSKALGCGVVFYCAAEGSVELMRELARRGADIHTRLNPATPALHAAVARARHEMTDAMIRLGCDPLGRDNADRTALHVLGRDANKTGAPLRDIERTAQLLLGSGIDPDSRDYRARTPLMTAAGNGVMDPVAVLINAGTDPTAVDVDGRTALHHAVISGVQDTALIGDIIALLTRAGIDIDQPDARGVTPVHLAVAMPSDHALKALLNAGADPDLPDSDGRTAADRLEEGVLEQRHQMAPLLAAAAARRAISAALPVNETASGARP